MQPQPDPQVVFREQFVALVARSDLSIREIERQSKVRRSTIDGWKRGTVPLDHRSLIAVVRVLHNAAGDSWVPQVERTWMGLLRGAKDARDVRSAAVVPSVRQSEQTRHGHHLDAVRQECMELIRAAWDLRTMTQNNYEYHGPEMGARLARVRERAADASVRSAAIALLATGPLADTAADLAVAAQLLAATAAKDTHLSLGMSILSADLTELDSRLSMFTATTRTYFGT